MLCELPSHKFVAPTSIILTAFIVLVQKLGPAGTDRLLPRIEGNKLERTVCYFHTSRKCNAVLIICRFPNSLVFVVYLLEFSIKFFVSNFITEFVYFLKGYPYLYSET